MVNVVVPGNLCDILWFLNGGVKNSALLVQPHQLACLLCCTADSDSSWKTLSWTTTSVDDVPRGALFLTSFVFICSTDRESNYHGTKLPADCYPWSYVKILMTSLPNFEYFFMNDRNLNLQLAGTLFMRLLQSQNDIPYMVLQKSWTDTKILV